MAGLILTIWGAPRTKKNHGRIVRAGPRHVLLPSAAWERWVYQAKIDGKPPKPLTNLYNCCARFYRDALRGDAVGYYQGLADFLEERGIVANDRLLVSWDGSRMLLDREHPRVELVLEPVSVLEDKRP